MTNNQALKPEEVEQQPTTRMTPAERLQYVQKGLDEKKSQRAIARELGCDEGTVRRDIKKLRLPAQYVAQLEQGAAAEPLLRRTRRAATLDELHRRIEEEVATECHSEAVAVAGLTYLLGKELFRVDEILIADLVEYALRLWGDIVAQPRRHAQRAFAHLERGTLPTEMAEVIEYYVAILTQGLSQIAPEKLIRERAIEKMQKAVSDPSRRPVPPRPWGCRIYAHEPRAWERRSPRSQLVRQGRPPLESGADSCAAPR